MPKCPVCDGEDFDLQDGLYYCTECSTQSQEIREEAVEDEYAEGTRSGRVVRGGQGPRRNLVGEEDCGPNWRMAEAFNIILREQVHSLVALGAGTHFAEASLQLWSQYLKQTEQAFVSCNKTWTPRLGTIPYPRDVKVASGGTAAGCHCLAASGDKTALLVRKWKFFHPKVRRAKETKVKEADKKRSRRKQMTKEGSPHDSDEECETLKEGEQTKGWQPGGRRASAGAEAPHTKKRANVLNKAHRFSSIALDTYEKKGSRAQVMTRRGHHYRLLDTLDMMTVLSVACLALRITQDTILLSDITRWIKEGRLPYLRAHRLLPSDWKVFPHEKVSFSPKVPPTVKSLHLSVRRLANLLGLLRVPVLEVRYVVARYIADMNLPFDLLPVANIVIEQFMSNKSSLSRMGSMLEFYAGVVILFVLKHVLGLDNKTERLLSSMASKENLEIERTGGEELFVWSEWEEQMKAVISYVRARNPFSVSFSPDDCQDVGVVLSYIQNFSIDASDSDCFSKSFQAKTVGNMMFVKKNLSNLRAHNDAHCTSVVQAECKEPPNSFPVRTILGKLSTRTGRQHKDFSHRKVHSARSQTYWFCRAAFDSNSGRLPTSFMVAFHVLQEILDWTLKDVIAQMAELETTVFALCSNRPKYLLISSKDNKLHQTFPL